ncbi:MAG: helix-turn-helix domain-containing protein [Brachybacterium sp.]|uniref:helix-turn-helix domain-containing protein n=1 Tax=Brachybacterium sp. TaxID=1891286 RepID=UPI0026475C12|nr:helix-turn-helix transcriptional regulator [Brachybacterium sp.]MDN5687110.1 helix-turn-helix domain-containing protein [Brachybacterium sp.]
MDSGESFAHSLRSSIERSGLSLTQISQRLRARSRPVSVATLSNWQSGRSLPGSGPSIGVVAALEDLLGRSPDSLVDLVGAPRLQGRGVPDTRFIGHRSSKNVFRDALLELGFESPERYAHERVFQQLATIDSSRDLQQFTSRVTVRALESGTCRLPAVHVLEPSEPNVAPQYIPLEGCTVGRTVNWPDRRAYGVELTIDGHLNAGQVATFAYRVDMHAAATDVTGTFYSLARRAHDVLLEAEFRGPHRPLRCERYRRSETAESVTPVRLDRRDRIQLAESRFGPGSFGLRWVWGEDDQIDDGDGDVDLEEADEIDGLSR